MAPKSKIIAPRSARRGLAALAVILTVAAANNEASAKDEAQVITLTQTGCQFLEPEGRDHMYVTMKKADCDAINAKTAAARLATAEVMTLKPGDYIFRVSNKNVPYGLGFWLREKDYQSGNPIHKLTKISVSGGGLATGTAKDYEVTLKPGEYLFSCPLNTTPDYTLIVSENGA